MTIAAFHIFTKNNYNLSEDIADADRTSHISIQPKNQTVDVID